MTPFETISHLIFALLPSLGALAFLLLQQRQRNQAELTDQLLQQKHREVSQEHESQRVAAFGTAAQAFAPVLGVALQSLLAKPDKRPSVADLSDEDLAAELRRRLFGAECDGCEFTDTPTTSETDSPEPPPVN